MRARRLTSGVALVLLAGACTLPGTERPDPAASAAGARAGGTLTVATTPPGSLDPATVSQPTPTPLSSLLCETLVTIDPGTREPRPGLAESWVVANGGRTLMVKLKRGQTFTDGQRFDSRAVLNSFRRLVNPQISAEATELLRPLLGYEAYRKSIEDGAEDTTLFTGVRVLEPFSFEINLASSEPDFVRTLAHPATAPISYRAAGRDPAAFGRSPACVGPYVLVAPHDSSATELRLRRWTGYHGEASAFTTGGRGWADEIVMRVFADASAGYQAWARGEVDVASVPASELAAARAAHGDEVISSPGSQVEYVGLPFSPGSPFNDRDVRRTLAAALDRSRIARDVYGGSRVPATGFLPPIVGDVYRPAACAFRPPDGPVRLPSQPVKLYFNDEFNHRRLVESVAAQWREKLGLAVEPVALNWDQYLQKATTGTGFDGAFRMSWTPSRVSALNYFHPLFHSREIGTTNLERYSDVEVDHILDRELPGMRDDGDRDLLLRRIEDRLCEHLPLIPLVFSQSHVAVRADRVASARADGRILSPEGTVVLRDLVASAPPRPDAP